MLISFVFLGSFGWIKQAADKRCHRELTLGMFHRQFIIFCHFIDFKKICDYLRIENAEGNVLIAVYLYACVLLA